MRYGARNVVQSVECCQNIGCSSVAVAVAAALHKSDDVIRKEVSGENDFDIVSL